MLHPFLSPSLSRKITHAFAALFSLVRASQITSANFAIHRQFYKFVFVAKNSTGNLQHK
jgi:hypothetical protein